MVMRGGNGAEEMTNLEEIEKQFDFLPDEDFETIQRLINRVKKLEMELHKIAYVELPLTTSNGVKTNNPDFRYFVQIARKALEE